MKTSPLMFDNILARLKEAGIDVTPEVLQELIEFAEKYEMDGVIGPAFAEFQKSFDELETASKKVADDKQKVVTDKSATVIVSVTPVVPQVDESNLTIAKEAFSQKYGELMIAVNTQRELIAAAERVTLEGYKIQYEETQKKLDALTAEHNAAKAKIDEFEKMVAAGTVLTDAERAEFEKLKMDFAAVQQQLTAITIERDEIKAKLAEKDWYINTLQGNVGKLEGIIQTKDGVIEALKANNAEKDKILRRLPANSDVESVDVDGTPVTADGIRVIRKERDEAEDELRKRKKNPPLWLHRLVAAAAILLMFLAGFWFYKYNTYDVSKERKALQAQMDALQIKYNVLNDGKNAEVELKKQLQAVIDDIGSDVGVNASVAELEKQGGLDRKRDEIGTKIKELQQSVGKSDDDRVTQLEGNLKQRDEEIAGLRQKVDANNGAALPAPPFLVEEAKCPPIVVTGDSNPFSLVKIPAKGTKDRFLFARVLSMEGEEPLFTVCRDPENMVRVHQSVDGYPLDQSVCRWKEKHADNDRQEE